MTTNVFSKAKATALCLLGGAALVSALGTGCSSSSTTTTDVPEDGGKTSPDSGKTTLYERLGGHSGIRSAVDAIVTAELMNGDIASYFFFQAGAPKDGHPTADQIEECFTDYVGNAVGGPEKYPTTLLPDSGSYQCRTLADAHADLKINEGTFTEFIQIAGGVLTKAGVASADITTLAGALTATSSVVVTDKSTTKLQAYPGDAGSK